MDKIIKVGISSCLLGQKVRYNGGHKLNPLITEIMGKYFEYVPVCPEVECGMGIPRETLCLKGNPARLMTTETKKDYTEQMIKWAYKRIADLEKKQLCGFIFKKKSPSCGMKDVSIFNEKGKAVKKGTGIFARAFMSHFPFIPAEEEKSFCRPETRENFIEQVFAFRQWREFKHKNSASFILFQK
ncbi:MAG: DUF523 domain-containing protein [Desulfobacteraceae bacterium]|nr:DUF523 domain-containing protein [Desulfobacteraceae bacterium]